MMGILKEFFGFGGYTREPEGYMSAEHLIFVTTLMVLMIALAVLLGLRNRALPDRQKNKVLVITAIAIDSLEIFKLIIGCLRSGGLDSLLYDLPLFLCSIQLITIPLAAFSRGRVREAALDFVLIFGILGAVLGTYGAGQNYNAYPVLSFDNVVSGLTHTLAGFASLYIAFSRQFSLKRRNIPITYAILLFFCLAAAVANHLLDYNYMFLVRGDGTPYDILYNLVGGHSVLYPLLVVLLFLLYIACFYFTFFLAKGRRKAVPDAACEVSCEVLDVG